MATQRERVIIDGSADGLKRTLTGATGDLRKFGESAKRNAAIAAAGFAIATAGLAALRAGANAAIDATIGSFKEFIQIGDDLATLSRDTGVATDELQRLGFIAEQSDITLEQLSKGLTKLTKTAGDAATGNKLYAETFDQLGVAVTDEEGNLRNRIELLEDVSISIAQLGNAEEKTAAVTNLFGRGGEKLVGVLDSMADGGEAVNAAFDKFVIPLTDADIKLAGDIDNIFLRINKQFEGARTRANAIIAPEVARLAEQFSNYLADALQNGGLLVDIYTQLKVELQDAQIAIEVFVEAFNDIKDGAEALNGFLTGTTDETEKAASFAEEFALFIAGTRDEFKFLLAGVQSLGNVILQILIRPMQGFLTALASVPLIGDEASTSLLRAADAAGRYADEISESASETRSAIDGVSEQEKLRARFAKERAEAEAEAIAITERAAQRAAAEANKRKRGGVGSAGSREAREAAATLAAAQEREAARLRADLRARELAAIKQDFEDRLISAREYFDQRNAIEREGIEDQIRINEQLQASTAADANDAVTEADRAKLNAQLEKIRTDGEILKNARVEIIDQLERSERQAYEAAAQRSTAATLELATAQGRAIEAQFAATATQLNDALQDAIRFGDESAQAAIRQLQQVNAERLAAAQADRAARTEALQVDAQRAQLDVQREQGLLTEIEYNQQIFALENSLLEIERQRLNAQLENTRDPAQAAAIRAQLAETEAGFQRLTEAQLAFQDSFRSNFSQFFSDTIRGADDAETRLRNLITGFFDDFVDRAANDLSEQLYRAIVTPVQQGTADAQAPVQNFAGSIVDTLGGAFKVVANLLSSLFSSDDGGGVFGQVASAALGASTGTGGGVGSTTGSNGLPANFASGGPVRGPGSGVSDSILARLSNGEYVQPARSVSHYGQSVMDAVKSLAIPRDALMNLASNAGSGLAEAQRGAGRRSFATGGIVGNSQQSNGFGTPSVVIENNGTPQRVRSSETERTDAGTIIRIVTEDIRNNGSTAQAMSGAFRLNR